MKAIHIIAGLLSLIAGAVALYAAKGSPLHRKGGLVFVVAMWTMTGSAVVMAAFLRPNMVNVIAGLLTFYMVSSALLTVRRQVAQSQGLLVALMLVALTATTLAFAVGSDGNPAHRGADGMPPRGLVFFGVIGVLALAGDARMLWRGRIEGAKRIARHLWRMGFAMFVATGSFFLGQAKFFPQPVRKVPLLAIPVLAVVVLTVYWLARVLRSGSRSTRNPRPPHERGPGELALARE